jgi:transposase
MDTGSSWRNLPEEEFGPWQTIYAQYRKWIKDGLWPRIVEVLKR